MTTWSSPYRYQPTSDGSKSGHADGHHQRSFGADENRERVRHRAAVVCLRGAGICRHRRGHWSDLRLRRHRRLHLNAIGRFLAPFGERKTFGIQAQGEYMFYPGRQEGQFDAALLYRRGMLQFGAAAASRPRIFDPRPQRALSAMPRSPFDGLMPAMRFGAVRRERPARNRRRDAVGNGRRAGPLGQPVIATEQVMHTIDQLGGSIQLPWPPTGGWMANLAYLHRHAPGVGDTAGGAIRFSGLLFTNVAFTAGFDVNESFLGSNAVGTFTFGVTLGRWSRPSDYSNPVNPLGTLLPRVRYERFQRVR